MTDKGSTFLLLQTCELRMSSGNLRVRNDRSPHKSIFNLTSNWRIETASGHLFASVRSGKTRVLQGSHLILSYSALGNAKWSHLPGGKLPSWKVNCQYVFKGLNIWPADILGWINIFIPRKQSDKYVKT